MRLLCDASCLIYIYIYIYIYILCVMCEVFVNLYFFKFSYRLRASIIYDLSCLLYVYTDYVSCVMTYTDTTLKY